MIRRPLRDQEGAALLIVFAAIFLMSVLSSGLVVLTGTEVRIASNYRESAQLTYVARSAFDILTAALGETADLSAGLSGGTLSSLFSRSPSSGMPPGSLPDVTTETALLQAMWDRQASHGPNSPQWRLVADGFFDAAIPWSLHSRSSYVIAWIADDEFETDTDPAADSNSQVRLHVESFGALGARQAVDGIVVRRAPFPAPLAVVGFRESDRLAH